MSSIGAGWTAVAVIRNLVASGLCPSEVRSGYSVVQR